MTLKKYYYAAFIALFTATFLFTACSRNKMKPDLTVDERMEQAIKLFIKKDYYNAKNQFRIITLSYSGHKVADRAQFYLAECHYYEKEYILAASEYERLIKVYPNSEYVDDAKYKLGVSYSKLAPKAALDQEYTEKAIKEFKEFLEDYYYSPLVDKVEKALQVAQNKLAKKKYEAATQYRKMGRLSAAIIYYTKVLESYYDSPYAPLAQYWLGECHRKLGEYAQAQEALNAFIEKYPTHELIGKARDRLKDVNEQLAKVKLTNES